VSWYSTQHNLLAYAFLARLGNEALAAGDRNNATTYYAAAAKIAAAVSSLLLVRQGSTAYFIEGLGDDVRALDTEALGIMFLQSLGQTSTADQVLAVAGRPDRDLPRLRSRVSRVARRRRRRLAAARRAQAGACAFPQLQLICISEV
jgi:phage tail tape-measure protein